MRLHIHLCMNVPQAQEEFKWFAVMEWKESEVISYGHTFTLAFSDALVKMIKK